MSDKPSNIVPLRTPLAPAQAISSLVSSLPWIPSFNATDPVPESAVAKLPEAVRVAEAACASASPQALAVAVARLVTWASRSGLYRFSPDPEEAKREVAGISQDFRDGLSDLPDDLLEQAVVGILRKQGFRNLPLAADIREPVLEELSRRREIQRRVRSAEFVALKLRRVEPDPYHVERTPEEIAAAAAMAETVRAMPVVPQTMPAQAGDLKPDPVADTREAVRRVMAETQGRPRIPNPWKTAASTTTSTGGGANG
jgi:hypothetical protein